MEDNPQAWSKHWSSIPRTTLKAATQREKAEWNKHRMLIWQSSLPLDQSFRPRQHHISQSISWDTMRNDLNAEQKTAIGQSHCEIWFCFFSTEDIFYYKYIDPDSGEFSPPHQKWKLQVVCISIMFFIAQTFQEYVPLALCSCFQATIIYLLVCRQKKSSSPESEHTPLIFPLVESTW